jgi:hypothetical protein
LGDPKAKTDETAESIASIADADTIDPGMSETIPAVKPRPQGEASFWRQVLWFGLDVDPRRIGGGALPLAGGIAVGGAFAVLFLLGEGWSRFSFLEMLAVVAGVGVGVVSSLETLTRRPALLLAPLAHVLSAVIVAVLVLRLVGRLELARALLVWSLALHMAALPLLARLWGTFLWQRRLGGATQRRAQLLREAKSGEGEHLLVRVVEVDGGQCSVVTLDDDHRELQIAARLLSPRPRPGLVYILPEALVINRTTAAEKKTDQKWAHHVIRCDDSLLLGFKAEVPPAEVATKMVRLATLVLAVVTAVITAAAFGLAG